MPTETNENPELYRMKLWATDTVAAKSKFWCASVHPTVFALHQSIA